MLSLNQRYVAIASTDRTVQVWDIEQPGTSMVQLTDFEAEVICMKKILVDQTHPLNHILITVENTPKADNIGVHNLVSNTFNVPVNWSSEFADYVTAIDILNQGRLIAGYRSGWFAILNTQTLHSTFGFNTALQVTNLLVLPNRSTAVVANAAEFTVVTINSMDQVFTASKGKTSAPVNFFRALGRNSEVFCASLTDGTVSFFNALNGTCVGTVQSGHVQSALILNFFSTEPSVNLLFLNVNNSFSYCSVDQKQVVPLTQGTQATALRGDPKMQILDLIPGSHLIFATVSNVDGRPPGLSIWKMSFR